MSNCRYSHPGSWGHECGKPAKWAQLNMNPEPGNGWIGGYWHVRCDECRDHTGPDNQRMQRDGWDSYDPAIHKNKLLCSRWPNEPEIITVSA